MKWRNDRKERSGAWRIKVSLIGSHAYSAAYGDLRQWRLTEPSNSRDAHAYHIGRLLWRIMVIELCVRLVKQPLDLLARRYVGDVRRQPDCDRVFLPYVAHVSGALKAGGMITVRIANSRATAAACSGPAPP